MIDFLHSCPVSLLIGAILILINFPLGWIGLVWFAHLAKTTGKKVFYYLGGAFYLVSWVVMLTGIFFCGKEYAAEVFRRYHTPIIAVTILTIISIIIFSRYFAKKDSKINKKPV